MERAGGSDLEIAGVHLVHLCKLPHVFQKDGGFHDALEGSPAGVENASDILEYPLGLRGDVTFYHLTRRGIKRNLPAQKRQSIVHDRL